MDTAGRCVNVLVSAAWGKEKRTIIMCGTIHLISQAGWNRCNSYLSIYLRGDTRREGGASGKKSDYPTALEILGRLTACPGQESTLMLRIYSSHYPQMHCNL